MLASRTRVRRAGVRVLHRTVRAIHREGDARTERLAERHLKRTLGAVVIVVAVAGGQAAAGFELRPARDEVDRSTGRVLAVQCSLRSLQDFDPLEIEEPDPHDRPVPLVDFVVIDGDRTVL